MKTNYLFAIVTVTACSRFGTASALALGSTLLKTILVAAEWQCAISLIVSRALAGAGLLLRSGLWDDKLVLFALTHSSGWLVKFLLFLMNAA